MVNTSTLDFKQIRGFYLLSVFGKCEAEYCIAAVLQITGDDTLIHFNKNDIKGKDKYCLSDFLYAEYIIKHEDNSYTITPKLINYINSKKDHILRLMKRGKTAKEVLGMD